MAENIRRTYCFVKYARAEAERHREGGPPAPRPRGRAPVLRAPRLRRSDRRPSRAGDRPLARGDLQLVPLEAGAVSRPRGRGQRAPARALRRARLRRAAGGGAAGGARLASPLPLARWGSLDT